MCPPSQNPPADGLVVHGGERFVSLVHAWLVEFEHNEGRAERTVEKYAGYLDRFAVWLAAPAPADARVRPSTADPLAATADDVKAYAGLVAHQAGLSPRSRRPLVAALRGFYAWAATGGHIPTNPAEHLPYPSYGRPLPTVISLAEAERMLMTPDINTFVGLRNAAMIAVLIGCGVRVSGLVAMNESSLHWTMDGDVERLSVRVTEKGKRDRLVPVPHECSLLLRAYLGHPELDAIDRNIDNGDCVLWVSTANRMIGPHEYHGARRRIGIRAVRDMLCTTGAKAKVPADHRHPHAFRHLYGTELTESGVPTAQLQGLMGHAKATDTEVYVHLAQRKLRAAVDAGNPLAKMRAPLLDSLRKIGATERQARASPPPSGAYNRVTRRPPKP